MAKTLLDPKVGQAMHQHCQHVILFFDYMNYKPIKIYYNKFKHHLDKIKLEYI